MAPIQNHGQCECNCPHWTNISISFIIIVLVAGLKFDTPMDKAQFNVGYIRYLTTFDFWIMRSDICMNGYGPCCCHHQLSRCHCPPCCDLKWEIFQWPSYWQGFWWRRDCPGESSSPSLCSRLHYQHPWCRLCAGWMGDECSLHRRRKVVATYLFTFGGIYLKVNCIFAESLYLSCPCLLRMLCRKSR